MFKQQGHMVLLGAHRENLKKRGLRSWKKIPSKDEVKQRARKLGAVVEDSDEAFDGELGEVDVEGLQAGRGQDEQTGFLSDEEGDS